MELKIAKWKMWVRPRAVSCVWLWCVCGLVCCVLLFVGSWWLSRLSTCLGGGWKGLGRSWVLVLVSGGFGWAWPLQVPVRTAHRTYTPALTSTYHLSTLLPACDHERPSERHAEHGPFHACHAPPKVRASAGSLSSPSFVREDRESETPHAFSCRISSPWWPHDPRYHHRVLPGWVARPIQSQLCACALL